MIRISVRIGFQYNGLRRRNRPSPCSATELGQTPRTGAHAPPRDQIVQSKCLDNLILTPRSPGVIRIAARRCFRNTIEREPCVARTTKRSPGKFPAGLEEAAWESPHSPCRVDGAVGPGLDLTPIGSVRSIKCYDGLFKQAGWSGGGWKTSNDRRVGWISFVSANRKE